MYARLSAFYLFYFAAVGVYVIFFPKALQMAGYTSLQIGTLLSAAPLMRFFAPFLFLKHLRLDDRTFLGALMLMSTGVLLFLPALHHFWLLLSVNLLFGAAMSVTLPFVETRALESLARKTYGRARLFGSIGFIAIALWLGRILETPYDAVHYLIATILLTALFGAAIVFADRAHAHADVPSDGDPFDLLRHWPLWSAFFLMQVSFGGFYNFFTIYETAHGISLETTSWLWSFGVICEIVMFYFQGPLLQKNLMTILKITIFATSLRWAMLWLFPDSLPMTFAAQSLHALSFALYHTTAITLLHTLYRRKALAQQFFLGISYGLGGFVGALVAGRLYDERLFLYESLIAFTAFVVLFFAKKQLFRTI
ncbi:MFS transporter [Hydrogenimonas urashimensis]|uniref:MFS transporter n=1 Tax=Hydrogenimonas urashimensis TaxID=2740515 RepID=UPI001915E305|nr:MFS transporter [Hydrogenimonas urashimensis]